MISNRRQVIACWSQVLSNGMSSNKHSKYHYHIIIQENDTDTGDQYKYKKVVLMLDINKNTGKL